MGICSYFINTTRCLINRDEKSCQVNVNYRKNIYLVKKFYRHRERDFRFVVLGIYHAIWILQKFDELNENTSLENEKDFIDSYRPQRMFLDVPHP